MAKIRKTPDVVGFKNIKDSRADEAAKALKANSKDISAALARRIYSAQSRKTDDKKGK